MIYGLAERLKSLREKRGFTQRETARRLKISPSVVSGYESGEKSPSLEVLVALSDIYGCTTDYILGKKAKDNAVTIDTGDIPEEQLQAVLNLIDTLKK